MRQKNYRVIANTDVDSVQRKVVKLLQTEEPNGRWEAIGGICSTDRGFYQAVVFVEDDKYAPGGTGRVAEIQELPDVAAKSATQYAPPLPEPDEHGHYRLPDGCKIYPACDAGRNGVAVPGLGKLCGDVDSPRFKNKWCANWKNGVPLRGSADGTDDRVISEFTSPTEAYLCILAGGEGV